MRWIMTKKAMLLARAALGSDDVWVDMPMRLGNKGEVEIYLASNPDEPKGTLKYEVSSSGGRTKVRLAVNEHEDEFQMPRTGSLSFKVASGKAVPEWEVALRRYGDAAIPMIAKVADSEASSRAEIEEWAASLGMDGDMARKVADAARPPMSKQAKKLRFEHGDRVRIVGPDMDFGELGWIMGKPRKNKHKVRLYMVIVDGSSEPREFPAKWLKPNDVGRVTSHA